MKFNTRLKILQSGGIVAFPTDTVYGLGALAFDNTAIESIYTAKDRPIEKAIPILIADIDDLEIVANDIPDMARIFASRFWPGPLTCIVPKKQTLPLAVSATSTVAVRIPDHQMRAPYSAPLAQWQSPLQIFRGSQAHPLRRKCTSNSMDEFH